MKPEAISLVEPIAKLDYSLIGVNSALAVEKGLAEADWYTCPIPRETLRKLLERRDGPAIRDTIIWFSLLIGSGVAGVALWGTWWAIIPFGLYGVIYASTSDSRWHEAGHGTAFRTDWMNNALYEIASFMVMRESTVWRWSHTRHHSDTIIVGRDPEIAVPRPPDVKGLILAIFNWPVYPKYFKALFLHSMGRMGAAEKTFIPESEFPKIYIKARIYLMIYLGVIALAIGMHSIMPLLFIGLPHIYGTWLMLVYGLTQHAGLAENVLDHRLNCRTVYMNPINRYLYWNMNYHVEHHMFPLVPYHALPRLHEAVKDDMPTPYPSLLAAWREIIPAILRQVKDPAYHVKRKLPEPRMTQAEPVFIRTMEAKPDAEGWIEVCDAVQLGREDVIRFDYARKTYALCQTADGAYYATDGICTHGNTHLSTAWSKVKSLSAPSTMAASTSTTVLRRVRRSVSACAPIRWKSARGGFFSILPRRAARARACRGPFIFAWLAIRTSPRLSRNWSLSRLTTPQRSTLPRGITCRSTFPRTTTSASANSTFSSPTQRSGRPSMFLISWPPIRWPDAATTIPSPATRSLSAPFVSTFASPRLRLARLPARSRLQLYLQPKSG